MKNIYSPDFFMRQAYDEAMKAYDANEVPIGAVIVAHGQIIGRGHNLTERLTDVTAHAEIQAITAASSYLGSKYLSMCTLYVTLEPCSMCAGALYWAQIGEIVFAAEDPQRGYRKNATPLHPKTHVTNGIMAEECKALLQQFFLERR